MPGSSRAVPATAAKPRDQARAKSFGLLGAIEKLIPGDWLKTTFYLKCIAAPRRALRNAASSFYRMDHVYSVLREFHARYRGPFSVLEFGTAKGYAFSKMLYATRYLGIENEVTIHAFDSFEGLRPPDDAKEKGLISNDWHAGEFLGDERDILKHCDSRGYKNYQIHKGYFENTLTPEAIEQFRNAPPILIWVDCDYYSSTRTIFERLLPVLRTGCVIYFDDYDFNFGSRYTGEARLVWELNRGDFGAVELVRDRELSWDSDRIYRFIRFDEAAPQFDAFVPAWTGQARAITNGSPLP